MTKLSILATCLLLVGCANQSGLKVKVDSVGGDFWVRRVATANQMVDTGQTSLVTDTPGANGTPPIGFEWVSRMQTKASSVEIKRVSGNVYFESAGSDNQGINIPQVLEKLYVPSDPLNTQSE